MDRGLTEGIPGDMDIYDRLHALLALYKCQRESYEMMEAQPDMEALVPMQKQLARLAARDIAEHILKHPKCVSSKMTEVLREKGLTYLPFDLAKPPAPVEGRDWKQDSFEVGQLLMDFNGMTQRQASELIASGRVAFPPMAYRAFIKAVARVAPEVRIMEIPAKNLGFSGDTIVERQQPKET